jgi:hypothetical protein
MKKGIIIDLRGQLGNQLWTYLSVWAYCREKGYDCSHLSFYQYCQHFPNTKGRWPITTALNQLNRLFPKKKSFIRCTLYDKLVLNPLLKNKKDRVLTASGLEDEMIFTLPPSVNANSVQTEKLKRLEESDGPIYFSGPAFRNPVGAAKYHQEIRELLAPRPEVQNEVGSFIAELRKKYDFLVGVHIRLTDYATFGEKFYFPPEKAAKIVAEFHATRPAAEKTCYIIASDEKIDLQLFGNLNVVRAPGKMIQDMFTLAGTDFIIGSNSTFSAFAAYYGDIPMAIFKTGTIDWQFYASQKKFFFDPESIAHLLLAPALL